MPSSLTPTRMKPAERLTPGELLLEREVARPEVLTRQRAYENSAEGGERLTRYASVHPHSLCLPLSTQSLLIFRAEASLAFDTGVPRVLKFCYVRCRGCAMLEAFDSLGWFLGGLSVKAAAKSGKSDGWKGETWPLGIRRLRFVVFVLFDGFYLQITILHLV